VLIPPPPAPTPALVVPWWDAGQGFTPAADDLRLMSPNSARKTGHHIEVTVNKIEANSFREPFPIPVIKVSSDVKNWVCYDKIWRHSDTDKISENWLTPSTPPPTPQVILKAKAPPPSSPSPFIAGRGSVRHRRKYRITDMDHVAIANTKGVCVLIRTKHNPPYLW
jgi:hypothetical protein